MNFLKNFTATNSKKLITHNGSFHADDIFACATLCLVLEKNKEKFEIIRTRDEEIIKTGDYVFDVGGVYDEKNNKFDHHQKDFSEKRKEGIFYSSFGLVWKKFGVELCGGDEDAWRIVDSKIVISFDAWDNGIDITESKIDGVMPYWGDQPFLVFSPTWREDEKQIDNIFKNEVKNAIRLLKREIEVAKADSLGKKIIKETYQKENDKRIIKLPNSFPRYLYQDILSRFLEPIYVIYKSNHSDTWKVEAIRKNPSTLENRKLFPESWRGLLNKDKKLKEITGVEDVLFCHRSGFLLTAGSQEGAIKLAQIAVES